MCLQANIISVEAHGKNQTGKVRMTMRIYFENQHILDGRDAGGQNVDESCCPVCQLTALLLP